MFFVIGQSDKFGFGLMILNLNLLSHTFVLDESTATVSTLCVWPLQI